MRIVAIFEHLNKSRLKLGIGKTERYWTQMEIEQSRLRSIFVVSGIGCSRSENYRGAFSVHRRFPNQDKNLEINFNRTLWLMNDIDKIVFVFHLISNVFFIVWVSIKLSSRVKSSKKEMNFSSNIMDMSWLDKKNGYRLFLLFFFLSVILFCKNLINPFLVDHFPEKC